MHRGTGPRAALVMLMLMGMDCRVTVVRRAHHERTRDGAPRVDQGWRTMSGPRDGAPRVDQGMAHHEWTRDGAPRTDQGWRTTNGPGMAHHERTRDGTPRTDQRKPILKGALSGEHFFAVQDPGELRHSFMDGRYGRVPEAEPHVVGAYAGWRELGTVVVADPVIEDLFLHCG